MFAGCSATPLAAKAGAIHTAADRSNSGLRGRSQEAAS